MEFYQCNSKMKPERLVFYRDGVSEGQFETVQRLEIPQARSASLAPGPVTSFQCTPNVMRPSLPCAVSRANGSA